MLYVFHGDDTHTAVTKAASLVHSLRAKRADASYVRIEADQWNRSVIEGHLGGQGLFSNKYIVHLDRVTENPDAREEITDLIPVMQESSNIFIVLEGKLSAELKKAFGKHAEKVVEMSAEGKKEERKEGKDFFNIFALADAVGSRDRFKAWSIYRQAVDQGIEAESIIGTLFWQVKSMKLAQSGKNAAETGLSPFVYSKAQKAVGNYSPDELDTFSRELIELYHRGHRGMTDLELAIERLMLRIGDRRSDL